MKDSVELAVYRLITPPEVYYKLLREYEEKHGDPYKVAAKILSKINGSR